MLKVLVGYPERDEELTVVHRSLEEPVDVRQVLPLSELSELQRTVKDVYVDPGLISYAVSLAAATREPASFGLEGISELVAYGASPRGPIALVQSARALALVHGRDYVIPGDIRSLVKDAFRHRLVLTYQALAEERIGGRRPRRRDRGRAAAAPRAREIRRRVIRVLKALGAEPTPDRPGPGPVSEGLLKALELTVARRVDGLLAGDHRSALLGRGTELAQVRPYVPGDDVRLIDWNVTARTTEPHVRVHLAERVLVTWIVLDLSPSMTFGTATRRKADVALGVTLAVGHAATIRGNRVGLVGFGGATERVLPPTQGRAGLVGLLLALRDGHEPDGTVGDVPRGRRSRASPARRASARSSSSSPTSAARATGARPLLRLAGRHQVVAMEIRDPREQALEPVGTVWLVDPESGRRAPGRHERPHAAHPVRRGADRRAAAVARDLASAGVAHAVLSTDGDWLRDLALFLRRHRR